MRIWGVSKWASYGFGMPNPKNVVFDLVGNSYDLYKYISDFFKITYIFVVASLDKLFNKFKYQEEIKYGEN
ncbi:hypothetical protein COI69_26760 [Bacillus cereus]|uniref:Uncharacterized protein n=1 Tax=Bacillus cereus TaxID=1396 RepID=A0A9X7E2W4_BACCE|nr:hypothetical protein COE70_25550 [Bacillus cereus]PHG76318.1 hypothetical protein COI69_26760 [Bacillus cereus]